MFFLARQVAGPTGIILKTIEKKIYKKDREYKQRGYKRIIQDLQEEKAI